MEEKTIFEKIVLGEIPCTKIYEDEDTFAFLDINPESAGHTLVIPKKAYRNILDLPGDLAGKIIKNTKKISLAIKESLGCDGIKIIMNNESASGQIVFHAHVHIIPCWEKSGATKHRDNEAEEIAKKIRSALK